MTTDWESAALAAGELDLAGLTRGWDDELTAHCERQYCLARWPNGTPDDFPLRLTAAQVFLHLRWLGEVENDGSLPGMIADLDRLAPLAARLDELDRRSQ